MSTLNKMLNSTIACFSILNMLESCANAEFITPQAAAVIMQSTIADTDLNTLSVIYGFSPKEILNFNATYIDTQMTWSGTLIGSYLGNNLNVSYSSDQTAFPEGAISWSSSGTYGSVAWSGNGTALFSAITTSNTFQISALTTLTVGNTTGVNNILINANISSDGNNINFNEETSN